MLMFSLTNKIALITGGYGHLGKTLTTSLRDAGASVIVCGRDENKFNRTFKERANIEFISMDVSSLDSIQRACRRIVDKHEKIDILVNNAFYCKGQTPDTISEDEWQLGIDGVLNSVFRCTKAVVPYMKKQRSGNIINISSMYGVCSPDFKIYKEHTEFFNPPNYGVSKAAIIQMTKYYAAYYANKGIRFNCISPGAFPSGPAQKEKSFMRRLENKIPLGRIGKPEDLKGVVIFLASDASSYIVGQNIIVDGGWTL